MGSALVWAGKRMPLFVLAALTSVAAVTVPAPVHRVTVYSDRARVTRVATVQLHGVRRLELPLLLDGVDPQTIWVEASGGEVRRVDLEHVDAQAFPRQEARELVAQLEKLDDQIARASGDRAAAQAVLQVVEQLRPTTPTDGALKAPPKLNPAGWSAALSFVASASERLQSAVRELDERLVDLGREHDALAERAQRIGGARRHGGYRVLPTVVGEGAVEVSLSYVVAGARWYPAYDLALQTDKSVVQVAFAGRVSQETGEDWDDAELVLSTAVPATSTVAPKLATWKIGERERFIPTPLRTTETPRPPPPAGPMGSREREDETLRRRLVALASATVDKKETTATGETLNGDRDADGIPDDTDGCPEGAVGQSGAPDGCPATIEIDGRAARLRDLTKKTEALKREVYRTRARLTMEQEVVLAGKPAPPPVAVSAGAQSYSFSDEVSVTSTSSNSIARAVVTTEVGLSPPSGWQAPVYAPDLPASLAGGYALEFPSLRPETVKSGKGARRVALFAETWPVSVERRIFPALAPEAYLVAEIKNPSSRVLPGGPAELFVGADPAGHANLKVVAPGEAFTLPLGLDRAVRPLRNVSVSSWEKGVFSKDDVSQYLVTTEVANPYRAPLKVHLVDQWPVAYDKNVEVKLVRADAAAQDKTKGSLEWVLMVPAQGKAQVSFVYTIRRPKGWRLHQ